MSAALMDCAADALIPVHTPAAGRADAPANNISSSVTSASHATASVSATKSAAVITIDDGSAAIARSEREYVDEWCARLLQTPRKSKVVIVLRKSSSGMGYGVTVLGAAIAAGMAASSAALSTPLPVALPLLLLLLQLLLLLLRSPACISSSHGPAATSSRDKRSTHLLV